ncbi:MAG TPA: AAA family ATPase [Acetobacteraceae bacterium]|jgi:succinoglycan biosynthesis transport protein ExoP|nr:AAA family ATPase [Acetobacteraceae bacterium]
MDNAGISLGDLWHTLRRRAAWLLLAAVLGGIITAAISLGSPIHYTSDALLEVESHTPLTRELNPQILSTAPDQVRTEADILKSRALAASVVRELDLAHAPDFVAAPRSPTWIDRISLLLDAARSGIRKMLGQTDDPDDSIDEAVSLFRKRLQVVVDDKSHIVDVSFQSGSPELSAKVIQTLFRTYLANQIDANLEVTSRENQWLSGHLAQLQHDVDQAAQRAQAYREANHLVDIQAGSLSALQLNQNEQDLANARQDLTKAQASYDTATREAKSAGGFTGQEALGSLLIQRLRDRESDIAARLANMTLRYGDTSPYVRPLNAELKSVRQQIASETGKIISALGRNVTTAQMRVKNLETVVAKAGAQAGERGRAEATLAQLNQEVEAKRHVYTAFLTRMEQTQLTSTQFPSARVVSAAAPPPKPDGWPLWVIVFLGMIVGVFVAVAIILARLALGGRIASVKDVEFVTGTTPITSLPALRSAVNGWPIAARILDVSQSRLAETLHALSFAIQEMNPDTPCTRVLVTSPLQGEGKTTLAASLARLSAASGKRVLLIEADLRRPTLRQALRLTNPGMQTIESVLSQEHTLAEAVQVDPETGLECLIADGSSPNVIKSLQSRAFSRLMEEAEESYDMVVIDSPPAMLVVDPIILAKYSDTILLTVTFGRTAGAVVAEAIHRFTADVRPRIATVLTKVPESEVAWHGYYAGYRRSLVA